MGGLGKKQYHKRINKIIVSMQYFMSCFIFILIILILILRKHIFLIMIFYYIFFLIFLSINFRINI